MDSFVNNIVNVAAIEEPLQNAEAKGTYTECESGVDEQVSVLQSPIRPPTHAKSKSRKRCSNNTEAEGTDTMCFSSIEEPLQNAEAKGTNTECEGEVDVQVSFSRSPISSSSCKVKDFTIRNRNGGDEQTHMRS